ncbi:cyclic AMP-responsive element-binding protein 3-like protein 1 [Mustelus asterias]
MDILDNFGAEKLFAASSLVDLEDLNEADFLSNVHFSENLDDFSNELFSSFFDDPLLAEKNPLLDMDLDPATPDIQAEHSYSLSGDSAPQSPVMPIKMDEFSKDGASAEDFIRKEMLESLKRQLFVWTGDLLDSNIHFTGMIHLHGDHFEIVVPKALAVQLNRRRDAMVPQWAKRPSRTTLKKRSDLAARKI